MLESYKIFIAMLKRSLILLVLCTLCHGLFAQHEPFKNITWSISVYNHSVSLPFSHIFKKPLNLGIAIGAEIPYQSGAKSRWNQRLELGWYHHAELNTAFWMKTDIVRRFQTDKGLFVDLNFGLGYLLDIPANESFKQDDDGTYSSVVGAKHGFLTNLGIGGGYNLSLNDQVMIAPFVKYETMIQLPYSTLLPFFPHSLVHVGVRTAID